MSLAEMEKKLILAVLRDTAGPYSAAEILGISREGLRMKNAKVRVCHLR